MPPGIQVSVKETAAELRLSHTPVREAFERLVGEGVLTATPDRHGFATPRPTVRDLAGLHRLFGVLLRGVAGGVPGGWQDDDRWTPDPADPSNAVEIAVARACSAPEVAIIAAAIRGAELRLVSHRLAEPEVVPDWGGGLIALRAGLTTGGGAALRAIDEFTDVRTRRAQSLVAAIEDLHR